MINENYQNDCTEVEIIILSLREAYLNNNKHVNSQSLPELITYIGYSDESSSRKLMPCDVCGQSDIDTNYICESCSMNGDGHGSVYKWCKNCGLAIHGKYSD